MKTENRGVLRLGSFMVLVSMLALLTFSTTAIGKEVALKWARTTVPGDPAQTWLEKVCASINEKGKGILRMQYMGGSEVVAMGTELDALRKGIIDIAVPNGIIFARELPGMAALQLIYAPPDKLRQAGVLDYINKRAGQIGLRSYGFCAITRNSNVIITKTPKMAESLDWNGIKVRTYPTHNAFVRAFGGTPVAIDPADLFDALGKGVVDAAIAPPMNVVPHSLYEVTKYYVWPTTPVTFPTFYTLPIKVWEGLPEDAKKILTDIIDESEPAMYKFWMEKATGDLKAMEDKGMKRLNMPPKLVDEFTKKGMQALWEDFVTKRVTPEQDSELRKILGPILTAPLTLK